MGDLSAVRCSEPVTRVADHNSSANVAAAGDEPLGPRWATCHHFNLRTPEKLKSMAWVVAWILDEGGERNAVGLLLKWRCLLRRADV
jgi:hypothetical protein